MKNRKRIIILIIATTLSIIVSVTAVFAWFIFPKNSITIVSGSSEISVTGEYSLMNDKNEPIAFVPLNSSTNNIIGGDNGVESNQHIQYKFYIKNKGEKKANVSLKLSDFSEYIFLYFDDYRQEYTGEEYIPSTELKLEINSLAEEYTAKFTLVVAEIYYISANNQRTNIECDEDMYLWKYAYGENLVENINVDSNETVTLCFSLYNRQSNSPINAYKQWLLGNETNVGYGQEYLANTLGYTYAALLNLDESSQYYGVTNIINSYLAYFADREIFALNPDAEQMSLLKLQINYFEFVCEG